VWILPKLKAYIKLESSPVQDKVKPYLTEMLHKELDHHQVMFIIDHLHDIVFYVSPHSNIHVFHHEVVWGYIDFVLFVSLSVQVQSLSCQLLLYPLFDIVKLCRKNKHEV
jgi:hypothetical protein